MKIIKSIKKIFSSKNDICLYIEVECIKCDTSLIFTKGEVLAKKIPICNSCFEKIKRRLSVRKKESKSSKEGDRFFEDPLMVF